VQCNALGQPNFRSRPSQDRTADRKEKKRKEKEKRRKEKKRKEQLVASGIM
jgi:hypothetical protein